MLEINKNDYVALMTEQGEFMASGLVTDIWHDEDLDLDIFNLKVMITEDEELPFFYTTVVTVPTVHNGVGTVELKSTSFCSCQLFKKLTKG